MRISCGESCTRYLLDQLYRTLHNECKTSFPRLHGSTAFPSSQSLIGSNPNDDRHREMEITKIAESTNEDTPRDSPANFGRLVGLPQIGVLEKTIVQVENGSGILEWRLKLHRTQSLYLKRNGQELTSINLSAWRNERGGVIRAASYPNPW